jgi:hypothetical protein
VTADQIPDIRIPVALRVAVTEKHPSVTDKCCDRDPVSRVIWIHVMTLLATQDMTMPTGDRSSDMVGRAVLRG